ncbi:hypothetical protein AMATHDRAFT_44298 [Amanita thiersii Skay4041]|uniref:Uncharacterized protein n=1 Tax=Amanita thiersii Skay4041 TaxID=703135 RepID=A0A2A9N5X8_9AGAR|nr:hypothetical protein AMATHDRAFT_44298 [Amanita thiersii Skay4041]
MHSFLQEFCNVLQIMVPLGPTTNNFSQADQPIVCCVPWRRSLFFLHICIPLLVALTL